MLLNQLVKINDAGIVADSVNFGLMEQKDTNQGLCDGFVFNYEKEKPEESTLGVLEALRSSYDSRSQANVHLLVQQYGKGKSHFAVAIANYFSQPAGSPELEGILHQVENASGGASTPIAEKLRLYKNRGRHLVICLSGDRPGDIRKQFLQVLLKTLEAQGIGNSIAQHICREPLEYWQGLSAGDREKAEACLESIDNADGDLNSLIQQLRMNNPAVIPTLKVLVKKTKGLNPDWNSDIDIEAILTDLITNFCTGQDAQFQGILILMDELNFYLQNWARDQFSAGGTALQSVTNVCENRKGKIALLSFTQIDPTLGHRGIAAGALDDYKRIVSRLAPKNSTYQKVASSLELVLDNLLLQDQKAPEWQAFRSTWDNTLLSETNNAYEKRITTYRQRGWSRDKFHKHLTIGCFPLHPLTSYLLCNLAFTVDRTALQFIKKEVKEFIQNQPLTVQGDSRLNFIYPIALIDTFLENFIHDANYAKYQEGCTAVLRSDNPNELLVLKALFLFSVSGNKIAKTEREPHEDVLASLTGLPAQEVKATLEILANTRDIVQYKSEEKLYKFWAGIAPKTIEQEIEELIKDRKESDAPIGFVAQSCTARIEKCFGSKTIGANHFVETNKLVLADWQFEHKIYTLDSFTRALSSEQTLRSTDERGIVAYVLAETQAELQDLRREINGMLAKAPEGIRQRIVVAISSDETGELAHVLLKSQTLRNIGSDKKQLWGTNACGELLKRWEEEVNTRIDRLLQSCSYHCIGIEKILPAEQRNLQRVISILLESLYPRVPPVDGVDKLRSTHIVGKKVIAHVCRQLLAENLTPALPDKTYSFIDPVFVTRWKLLKKTSQKYIVQEPTHDRIKAAWDEISQWADLGEQPEKTVDLQKIWATLSAPPYGYSEYNFTMLLTGWLAYHRKEVRLKGRATLQAKGDVTVETKSLKEWAATDILANPQEFVKKWILATNAKLIRRKRISSPSLPQTSIDYLQAEQYLQSAQEYLDAGEPDPTEIRDLEKVRDKINEGVERIQAWFQPVEMAEALLDTDSIESLVEIYPKLLVNLPIDLREDIISVKATAQQRERQNHVLKLVNTRIQQLVDLENDRAELLSSEAAYGSYKANVGRILAQMKQATELPPHFPEALETALKTSERRLLELREEQKVQDCLTQIQNRYDTLRDKATQKEYQSARQAIESMAQEAPKVKLEAIYDKVLQDLDQGYANLNQQLERWEEQSSGLNSPAQILELRDDITRHQHRFDEESGIQKTVHLLEILTLELNRDQSDDAALSSAKAALSSASDKLDHIRDKAGSDLPDAFHVYQELAASCLPAAAVSNSTQKYQQTLEEFKTKGRETLINRGFAKIYTRELRQLADYNELKKILQKGLEFISPHTDFADVKASFEYALENLEIQNAKLQKQEEENQRKENDEQLIRNIRSKRASLINTIQALEESLREVADCQSRFHNLQLFGTEIDQILQTLQEKKAGYQGRLRILSDRLAQISNQKDLNQIQGEAARLEVIFEGSTEYSAFQTLQQSIQHLSEDLEKLQSLEIRCQQSRSIAQWNKVLITIGEERSRLHYGDRFQTKIAALESEIQESIRIYTNKLLDFEQQLEFLTSVEDAHRFQQEVQGQASRYDRSDLSERYKIVCTSIRLLIALLQFPDVQKIKTLADCQANLDSLTTWKKDNEPLTQLLQDRCETRHTSLEEAKTQLIKRQKSDAETWLKSLGTEAVEIFNQVTEDGEKIKQINRLLEKIKRGQENHFEHLSETHQGSLNYIVSKCEAEMDNDRENKIKVLFQQLTRSQRAKLYRQLEAYLLDDTEVFDG
jgi:hypothetical protein